MAVDWIRQSPRSNAGRSSSGADRNRRWNTAAARRSSDESGQAVRVLSAGYSPALGFIHIGKQLSFVYDIADLYKAELTIPLAFRTAAAPPPDVERHVRLTLRDVFRESKLVQRIIPDIRLALADTDADAGAVLDEDPALPTDLWTPSSEMMDEDQPPPTEGDEWSY